MKKFIILILLTIFFARESNANQTDNLYKKLDLFSDVLETLNNEYVDPVDENKVLDAAINGMLQSLDPYSSYMSPENFRNMNAETKGEFGGLGIEITMQAGLVKVISPIEGTPADKAGIKAGDFIIRINNTQVSYAEYRESGTAWDHMDASFIYDMNANDYYETWSKLTGTGQRWNGGGSSNGGWDTLSIYLLG